MVEGHWAKNTTKEHRGRNCDKKIGKGKRRGKRLGWDQALEGVLERE
jgi:hypothetical protein